MTADILPAAALELLRPEAVTPGLIWLVSEQAPTRTVLCAGGGSFEVANVTLTQGVHLGLGPETPEQLAAKASALVDRSGERVPHTGFVQVEVELAKAGVELKIT
jgi:hypothetical protein